MNTTTISIPTPPSADRTITLQSTSQQAFEAAINSARVGEVTKIVLPKDANLTFGSRLPTFDIQDKKIVIDFNGASIKFTGTNSLSFTSDHEWVRQVSSLGTSGGDTTVRISNGVPSDLRPGDWVKIISDDTTPGDRASNRFMGQALQVESIENGVVRFDGQLSSQELYKTNIRIAKYDDDAGIHIINPVITGVHTSTSPHIRIQSIVEPVIESPELSVNGGAFLTLADNVNSFVTNPRISNGHPQSADSSLGFYSYAIATTGSSGTLVYSDNDDFINFVGTRNPFDPQQHWVNNKNDIHNYGPDHGARVVGTSSDSPRTDPLGSHSGGWGTIFEDITVSNARKAATIRGQDQLYQNIHATNVERGLQFYNESNEIKKTGEYDAFNIRVQSSYIETAGTVLYTAGRPGDHRVDEIHFQNNTFKHTGGGWFASLENAKGDWSFTNDTIILTGSTSRLFNISGANTTVDVKGLVLDLSNFKGSSLTLFSVDAGSSVDVDELTIINPRGVRIIEAIGAGDVDIDYGARTTVADDDAPPAVVGRRGPNNDDDDDDLPDAPVIETPATAPTAPAPIVSASEDAAVRFNGTSGADNFALSNGAVRDVTIANFKSVTGNTGFHDTIDISAVFDRVGGRFSDGVNDLADRRAALSFQRGDFDRDGQADDVQFRITGVDNFRLTFVNPDASWQGAFDIGNGTGQFDNIIVQRPAGAARLAVVDDTIVLANLNPPAPASQPPATLTTPPPPAPSSDILDFSRLVAQLAPEPVSPLFESPAAIAPLPTPDFSAQSASGGGYDGVGGVFFVSESFDQYYV